MIIFSIVFLSSIVCVFERTQMENFQETMFCSRDILIKFRTKAMPGSIVRV